MATIKLRKILFALILIAVISLFFATTSRSSGIDANTVLMLHTDGTDGSTTFTDSETTPKTVTANGNAQIDTAQSKFGGASGLFDGTGDYLSLADSDDWNFGSGNFTIDAWVYVTDFATNIHSTIFNQYVDGDNWFYLKVAPGAIYVTLNIAGAYPINEGYAVTINTNTWYHIALTRSGNTWRTFKDGVQVGSVVSATAYPDMAAPLYIGRNVGQSNTQMTGNLDEVRVSKGIARWTAGFTPPTSAYDALPDNTCTYSSGDWSILASDKCSITTANNLGGNDFICTGTGTVDIGSSGKIINFGKVTIHGGCVLACRNANGCFG